MKDFRITIASLPDRENLVAEISYKNKQVAEINQETKKLIIQLYAPSKEKKYWEFSLESILNDSKTVNKNRFGGMDLYNSKDSSFHKGFKT